VILPPLSAVADTQTVLLTLNPSESTLADGVVLPLVTEPGVVLPLVTEPGVV
jgi:hypothetical protein